MSRGRCIVESPLHGDYERNTQFAKSVCRALVQEGYNPYASHLFFTQFLDDTIEEERQVGIIFGLEWAEDVHLVFLCLRPDEEMSPGMQYGLSNHRLTGKVTMLRRYTQDGELLSEEEV